MKSLLVAMVVGATMIAQSVFAADLKPTPKFLNAACNKAAQAACAVIYPAFYPQVVIAIRAAKSKFRDRGECEDVARHAGQLAERLSFPIANFVSTRCGECACGTAYD